MTDTQLEVCLNPIETKVLHPRHGPAVEHSQMGECSVVAAPLFDDTGMRRAPEGLACPSVLSAPQRMGLLALWIGVPAATFLAAVLGLMLLGVISLFVPQDWEEAWPRFVAVIYDLRHWWRILGPPHPHYDLRYAIWVWGLTAVSSYLLARLYLRRTHRAERG